MVLQIQLKVVLLILLRNIELLLIFLIFFLFKCVMSLRLSLYAFFLLCFSNSVSLSLSCFFSLLLYYLCRYQFSFFFLPTSLFLYDRFSLILLFLFIYFFLAFLLYKLFLVSPFRSFNVSLPYSKTDFSSFFMNFSINVRYFSIDSL